MRLIKEDGMSPKGKVEWNSSELVPWPESSPWAP